MRQPWQTVFAAWLLLGTGCLSTLPIEPPVLIPATPPSSLIQNPMFVPLGPESYGQVFENVLESMHLSGFSVQESNRYDGRIEALPRVAPGIESITSPGSPSIYERLLATFQTYRHRLSVNIQPADNGGFFIEVIARKELEDLGTPSRATAGSAVFRNDANVERPREVIDPVVFEPNWIFKGRDVALEQKILRLIKKAM